MRVFIALSVKSKLEIEQAENCLMKHIFAEICQFISTEWFNINVLSVLLLEFYLQGCI